MASSRPSAPVRAVLRLLEFLERLGIVEDVRRNLHLRRLGARLDDVGQHLAFLRGIAFDRLHQVGDEVGATLILVQHLAPSRLGLLLQRGNGVDAAAGEHHAAIIKQTTRATLRPRRCVSANMVASPEASRGTSGPEFGAPLRRMSSP